MPTLRERLTLFDRKSKGRKSRWSNLANVMHATNSMKAAADGEQRTTAKSSQDEPAEARQSTMTRDKVISAQQAWHLSAAQRHRRG